MSAISGGLSRQQHMHPSGMAMAKKKEKKTGMSSRSQEGF